jgi:GTP-binding protein
MSSKAPIVAIIGRTNVGKSSLFNLILKKREAITADEAGTTRDSLWARASWEGQDFWLVDTAGVKDPEDDFELTIQEQIDQASESADIIMLVIESDVPITEDERRLAKKSLKTKKPVMLVVNKHDKNKKSTTTDFNRLGIKDIYLTSVTQNSGVSDLLDKIISVIPRSKIKQDPDRITFALLGRPNVGKSYLFNALSKKQQAIVSERAGTTRDINRTDIRYKNKTIELLDTAGIRRSGKIEVGVEKFSVLRSLSAIEQSDVCAMVMDVNELGTQLDQKIAGMIKESGKGLIIIVSKWDSLKTVVEEEPAEEKTPDKLTKLEKKRASTSLDYAEDGTVGKTAYTRDTLAPRIKRDFIFIPWAPLVFTSAVSGQNVTKIFDLILDIHNKRQTLIKTPALNKWLSQTTDQHPPAGLKNRNPKLHYIVQESDNPTNFKVYGSDTNFLHWSYKRFMERKLREEHGFEGTPIRFWFFDRKAPTPTKPKNV